MSFHKIVRAWEDSEYRHSLSAAELAALPENPAGGIELTDAELGHVVGAMPTSGNTYSHSCNCKTTTGNSAAPKCCG